jgi:hypothetical protein
MWKLRLSPISTSPAIPDIFHIDYLRKASHSAKRCRTAPHRPPSRPITCAHTAPSASSFRSRSSYPKQTLYVHSRFLSNVYDSIRRLASLLVTHEGGTVAQLTHHTTTRNALCIFVTSQATHPHHPSTSACADLSPA